MFLHAQLQFLVSAIHEQPSLALCEDRKKNLFFQVDFYCLNAVSYEEYMEIVQHLRAECLYLVAKKNWLSAVMLSSTVKPL